MDPAKTALNDLPVRSGGRILIVGGTVANSIYFLPAVLNFSPESVDLLGIRKAHEDHFRAQLPGCIFLAGESQIELDGYDLIVLDLSLSQLALALTQWIQHKWAYMLKAGGCILTYGLNARATTDAKIPQDLRSLFAAGGSWHAPSSEDGALLPWFRYLYRVSRNPAGGNLSWESLTFVAPQERRDLISSLAPHARAWGELVESSPFVDYAVEQRAFAIAHEALMSLFNNRDIRGYRKAAKSLSGKLPPALAAYHRLNVSRYAGEVLDGGAWKDARAVDIDATPWLGNGFHHLLLDQAVRQRDCAAIEEFVARHFAGRWGTIGDAALFGVARLYLDEGLFAEGAEIIRAALQDRPDWYHLKFGDLLRRLSDAGSQIPGIAPLPAGWRAVTKALQVSLANETKALPSALQTALASLSALNDALAAASSVRDCIDLRSQGEQGEFILRWIEDALGEKRPGLLLRLGDGEAYALSGADTDTPGEVADADNLRREWIWWGEAPPPHVRAAIKAGVRECMAQADIIGVPSVYRLLRDLDADPRRFGESASQRGLSIVMSQAVLPANVDIVTEERCHQILFGMENLRRLSRSAQSVVWVTSWPLDRLRLDAGVPEYVVHVPPGVQIEEHADAADRPFWRHYEAKLDALASLARPGALVLVAGGIIGKLFLSRAKGCGAVALDIGSMADYIAGYRTRSTYDL